MQGAGSPDIRIGRSPESDIVLNREDVSWAHAVIRTGPQGHVIEDLASMNGTSIHTLENRIDSSPLRPGDVVFIASYQTTGAKLLEGRRLRPAPPPGAVVPFKGNVMELGRDPFCDYPIDDPKISWRHARVRRLGQSEFEVTDLASLNGTFVNEKRVVSPVRFTPNDRLMVGPVLVRIDASGTRIERSYQGHIRIDARDVGIAGILAPVGLTVFPSELVAIMGPSGAGKTTLLNALNGYQRPSGRVLINGHDLYAHYNVFRSQIGYVPQEDIMHPQLTVREVLYYTARLRTDLKPREISALIGQTLDRLQIADCANKLVGSVENKVLSGGQRKRVNVGMEMMSRPSLLFLDEPTSGLSSGDADNVVMLLKELAGQGNTVIVTIHQPGLAVFKAFDGLVALGRSQPAAGRLIYYGPAYPDSIDFLNPAGCRQKRAEGGEPGPELLFRDVGTGGTTVDEWAQRYGNSRYKRQYVDQRIQKAPPAPVNSGPDPSTGNPARRFDFRQVLPLVERTLKVRIRDKVQAAILLIQAPLIALVLLMVYRNIGDSPGPFSPLEWKTLVGKISGTHFMMTVAAVWFGCNVACREIVGEWAIYRRERMVSLKIPSYIGSKLLVLGGFCAAQCFVLLAIVSISSSIRAPFGRTYFVLLLCSLTGIAIGLFVSALSKTTESAVAALPIILLPMILLSGGMKPLHEMDQPAPAIAAVMPTRWAFEANLLEEARHRAARGPLTGAVASAETDVAENHFPVSKKRADFRQIFAYLIGMIGFWITLLAGALKWRDIR